MVNYKFADKDFQVYYYCYCTPKGKPKKKHKTLQDAMEEAKRIAEKENHKVKVLMCQVIVEKERKTK